MHRRRYFAKPRLVICVPSGVTPVEQRAVKEAGYQAGARRVYIIEEPMAAAIGAGLPVHEATGNMVVDIGGGTTEVAVISLGGLVTTLSVRTAGDELDQAIVAWMKKEHSLMLGERHRRGDQDDPRLGLPAAAGAPAPRSADATWSPGLPRTVTVSSAEIRKAIEEQLHTIVDAVRTTLDQTPPELAGDIMDRGIVLTGGGALLRGLDERLRHETGMPVHVAHDPLSVGRARLGQVRGGVRGAPAGAGLGDPASERLMRAAARGPARPGGRARRTPDQRARRVVRPARAGLADRDHRSTPAPATPRRSTRCAASVGEVVGPAESGDRDRVPAVHRHRRLLPHQRRPARGRRAARVARTPRCGGRIARRPLDRKRLAELDGLTRTVGRHRLLPGRRPRRGDGADAVVLPHGHHRRRHLLGRAQGHDRAQQRRPGRPGRPRHPLAPPTVLLIVDTDSVVGGRLGTNIEIGFLRGRGSADNTGRLALDLVDNSVEPSKDDLVVTWGSKDGVPYVAGIPIGRVESVVSTPRQSSRARRDQAVRRLHRARRRRGRRTPGHRGRPARDRPPGRRSERPARRRARRHWSGSQSSPRSSCSGTSPSTASCPTSP